MNTLIRYIKIVWSDFFWTLLCIFFSAAFALWPTALIAVTESEAQLLQHFVALSFLLTFVYAALISTTFLVVFTACYIFDHLLLANEVKTSLAKIQIALYDFDWSAKYITRNKESFTVLFEKELNKRMEKV